jgi:RING-like zinc finger
MGYVTSFIVLLLLSARCAEASLGEDSTSDTPSVWQYIVIALSLAFAFMTGKANLTVIADSFPNYSISTLVMVCVQVARLRRRSELVEQGMRPVIHITRSGARVYAPLPILSDQELEQIAIVDYSDGNLEEQSCSICLDLFRPSSKVRLLPCRHAFHPICIGVWGNFF